MVDKLKEEVNSRPIIYIVIYILIAAACIAFPLGFIKSDVNRMWVSASLRLVFSGVGIIFMIMSGFSKSLKISKAVFKNFDVLLLALLIAINNFPIIALVTGKATVNFTTNAFAAYLLFCISVGIFEEVFFRGLVFSILLNVFKKEKYGDFFALILSSAIFGLVHLLNLFGGGSVGAVMLQVGYTFLNGMVFALLLYFTKSIIFPILCHALFDIGGLLVSTLGSGAIWNTETIILTAVLGSVVGIYLTIRFFLKIKKTQANFKKA